MNALNFATAALIAAFAFVSAPTPTLAGPHDFDIDIDFSVDGDDITIDFDSDEGMPQPDSYVCFYKHKWFGGSKQCHDAGEARAHLNSWDDKISSLEVEGAAIVTVCSEPDFGGDCRTYDANASELGAGLDNDISSFQVTAFNI